MVLDTEGNDVATDMAHVFKLTENADNWYVEIDNSGGDLVADQVYIIVLGGAYVNPLTGDITS